MLLTTELGHEIIGRSQVYSSATAHDEGIAACDRAAREATVVDARARCIQRHGIVYSSRAKDELLGVTSHEWRTPLNAILGRVRLLRMGHLTDDKRERALETIERNATVQVQLVEDLLDFNRASLAN